LLEERLALALRHAESSGGGLAVCYLDLDRLKVVNDALGHAAGDALLRGFAERLTRCLRREDTVARVGGDEFVLLLPAVRTRKEGAKVAQKVFDGIGRGIQVEGQELYVTISMGVALYPQDGTDGAALQRRADEALYRAKQLGRNRCRFAAQLPVDAGAAR